MKSLVAAILICVLALSGCAAQSYQVHPGAAGYITGPPTPVQTFASQSYDTLVAADAVIVQTRADFLGNKFSAAAMPTVKTAFNALVQAYDTAQAAWIAFNQSASTNPSVSEATLSAAIAGLNVSLTNLATARGAQ
jgi:hypothetical protein